jgi:hypothetical protein
MRTFAELDFIAKHENLVLVGKTGVGKTGLACGLLLKALQNGYRCQFVRAQDLFDEMYASLADRSTRRLLNRLARLDVLLIDATGIIQTGAIEKAASVSPAALLSDEYASYLHRVRGSAASTISHHRLVSRCFLKISGVTQYRARRCSTRRHRGLHHTSGPAPVPRKSTA